VASRRSWARTAPATGPVAARCRGTTRRARTVIGRQGGILDRRRRPEGDQLSIASQLPPHPAAAGGIPTSAQKNAVLRWDLLPTATTPEGGGDAAERLPSARCSFALPEEITSKAAAHRVPAPRAGRAPESPLLPREVDQVLRHRGVEGRGARSLPLSDVLSGKRAVASAPGSPAPSLSSSSQRYGTRLRARNALMACTRGDQRRPMTRTSPSISLGWAAVPTLSPTVAAGECFEPPGGRHATPGTVRGVPVDGRSERSRRPRASSSAPNTNA
jgi:hypothetical protein